MVYTHDPNVIFFFDRLERASSHQLYNSHHGSYGSSSAGGKVKLYHNTSIPHFVTPPPQQQQTSSNVSTENQSLFGLSLSEAQRQLILLQHQQELEETRRLQQKFQNSSSTSSNSKLSFLSDPHLLRSLKIASMANLNPPAPSIKKSPFEKSQIQVGFPTLSRYSKSKY